MIRQGAGSHITQYRRVRFCEACGKYAYGSRKDARAVARSLHPGEQLVAYECPDHDGEWHYGHRSGPR